MKRELVIARMPIREIPARMIVYYEDGRPVDVFCESITEEHLLGTIVLGVIEQVLPGAGGAFVRIAPDRRVYLPFTGKDGHGKAGDEVAVQICQEAQKTKLPKVQTTWELPGRYLILSTASSGMAFSRRLGTDERDRLATVLPEEITSSYHVLFRTQAGEHASEEIRAEAEELAQKAQEIRQRAKDRPCYTVLYRATGLPERLLQRYAPEAWHRVQTDDPAVFETLRAFDAGCGYPLSLYEDPQLALYRLRDLSALLDRLLRKEVTLPSGGALIIEQTEAFAAIDVNTARVQGKKTAEETVRRVNREAAVEAARQIRLRQLSGTILIDFINTTDPAEEKELMEILQAAFREDAARAKVVDFTRLKICEITRRKTHRPLAEQVAQLSKGQA